MKSGLISQKRYDKMAKRCREMGYEPGPFGCLCQEFRHFMVGDGCCICNPDYYADLEEEEEGG